MLNHSQVSSRKAYQYNVASLDALQPRENALKGSADYSAPTQKALARNPYPTPTSQIFYANDVTIELT